MSEEGRPPHRRWCDLSRGRSLPDGLVNLDELRGPRLGVRLEPAALSPAVSRVMMIDVAEQQAVACLMNDQPDVAAGAHRPEVLVFGAVDSVEVHARLRWVELQVEGGGLDEFLLVAG